MNQYEFVVVFFSSLSFTINNTIYTLIFDRLRICTIWFHCFFFFAWEKHSNSNSTTTITYMFFRFFFVWDGCQMVTLWFSILFLRNLPDRKFIDLMWVKRKFYIYDCGTLFVYTVDSFVRRISFSRIRIRHFTFFSS